MAVIDTSIQIKAPLCIVFDLCRSIDMHVVSTNGTDEKAIEGRKTGLILAGETVTWQARHLLKTRKFKTIITAMEPYRYFRDEMAKGDFKSFFHEHYFEEKAGVVIMRDVLTLVAPYGFIGKIAEQFFLKNYIQRFLVKRNMATKHYAESGEWKKILNSNDYN